MSFSWETYQSLLWSAIAITCAALAGVLLHHLLSRVAQRVADPAHHLLLLCLIAAVAWLAEGFIGYLEHLVSNRYQVGTPDDLQGRRIRTQVQLFRRIAEAVCRHCGCEVFT